MNNNVPIAFAQLNQYLTALAQNKNFNSRGSKARSL